MLAIRIASKHHACTLFELEKKVEPALTALSRNYFWQGREDGVVKLPVKWMSLESLNDGVFTEKTDVVRTELEVERCTMFV